MIASQSLKSVDFTKAQKSRHLKNKTFFHQIKKIHLSYVKDYFMAKNNFVAEVTFKYFFPTGT